MRREPGVRRALIVSALLLGGWALAPAAPRPVAGLAGMAALCDSCPAPNRNVRGVEWRDGDLWTVSGDGTLTHVAGCTPIDVVSVNAFRDLATGLGWDTHRNLWVVADAKLGEIDVVDVKGNVVRTFPAPGTGPAGVGYDAKRDAICVELGTAQVQVPRALSAVTSPLHVRPRPDFRAADDHAAPRGHFSAQTAGHGCHVGLGGRRHTHLFHGRQQAAHQLGDRL
jgi:hypothetical protein